MAASGPKGIAHHPCLRSSVECSTLPVLSWHWEVPNEEVCGICQAAYESTCPACHYPGDNCPLMSGPCQHAFHMHCIVKWLQNAPEQRQHCPMCRRPWAVQTSDPDGESA